jgi:hypothetical protein
MADIFELPENHMSKEDRKKLESFGGHTIANGRATRWHWTKTKDSGDVFEIFRGGAEEIFAARIYRDGKRDVFFAHSGSVELITSGTLEHVLAETDNYFIQLHGESPNMPV